MKSLNGYFELIDGKPYIDSYPSDLVKLDNLKGSILVEFGGGIGNDIFFMINSLNLKPKNLYFIDIDPEAYKTAFKRLKSFFGILDYHLLLRNAIKSNLKSEFADFVYANNMLHDLENKKDIETASEHNTDENIELGSGTDEENSEIDEFAEKVKQEAWGNQENEEKEENE